MDVLDADSEILAGRQFAPDYDISQRSVISPDRCYVGILIHVVSIAVDAEVFDHDLVDAVLPIPNHIRIGLTKDGRTLENKRVATRSGIKLVDAGATEQCVDSIAALQGVIVCAAVEVVASRATYKQVVASPAG